MKKIYYSTLAILAACLTFSCVKSEMAVNDEKPSEKVFRTITLQLPSDPETKVSLDGAGKTAWQAGDEILIHGQKMGNSGEDYYSRVVTLAAGDIKDEGKTATFTFEEFIVDKSWGRTGYKATMFAAYPASNVKSVSGGTSWYYTTGFDQTQGLLLGGCNNTDVNDGNTFTFLNLNGVLSFVVSGDFDSYVFTGNNSEIVDYDVFAVRVDMESTFGDKVAIPYTGSSGIKCSGEKTSLSGSVVADGSTVNYLYFPGGVNLTGGFTIKFLKGGVEQQRVSTNTAKNIARGKYLKLGDISSHLYTYTPPATHTSTIGCPADDSEYNLSKTESANCYVVDGSVSANADKVFKFKAVKGNSDVSVGTINSVTILWETWNDVSEVTENSVIEAVDYDKQAEKDYSEICFKMPATIHTGNAVIAAKDKSDNILWSWHIWVPETTVTNAAYGGIFGSNGMDRQLGALIPASDSDSEVQDPKSFGLMYQWGRKDPFMGGYTPASGVMITSSHAYEATSSSPISLPNSIMHPTQFAYNGETAVDPTWAGENWCSDYDANFWGGTSGDKSQYDPCPPGYKVPKYDSSLGLWQDTDWSFDTTNLWFKKEGAIFPYSSYLDDCNGKIKKKNNRTKVWSATAYTGVKSYIIYVDGSSLSITSAYNAAGAAVRCCVDE